MKAKINPFTLSKMYRQSQRGSRPVKRIISPGDRMFYAACGLFVLGIAIGALLVSFDDLELLKYLSYLTKTGIETRAVGMVFATFVSCLIPHLVIILACWLLSNCTFGMPFIIFIVVYKGAGAGLMGGYIYRYYGGAGILYNLLITMPPTLIAAMGFLWFAVSSVKSSAALYSVAVKGAGNRLKDISAEVYHSLAIAGVLSCISAIVEALLFKAFGGYFL